MKINLNAINTKELFNNKKFVNYLYTNFSHYTYEDHNCQKITDFYIGEGMNKIIFADINWTNKETTVLTGNVIYHVNANNIEKEFVYKFFSNVNHVVNGFIEEF